MVRSRMRVLLLTLVLGVALPVEAQRAEKPQARPVAGVLRGAAQTEANGLEPRAKPQAKPGKETWRFLSPAEQARVVEDLSQRPLPERLVEVSRRFLDTPYVVSPLGEGTGKDADPTFRLDAVDCLTFVEETIALSLAKSLKEVEPLLNALRYAHELRYEDRNHLMEGQWLPNNEKKGFVRDVTRLHGGADTVQVIKHIPESAWASGLARSLDLPRERHVTGDFPLEFIPLNKVAAKAQALPTGTVLVVVREDAPFRLTRITHLGFVVQKEGRTFIRHAAMSVYGRVVDEELSHFVGRNLKYDKWRVSGVLLLEVQGGPPDTSSLSAQPASR